MATPFSELELLGPGIRSSSPGKEGAFVRNMIYDGVGWTVRLGFGTLWMGDCAQQYNPITGTLGTYGYRSILGSHIIQTNFGHTQIVTVLTAELRSANCRQDLGNRNRGFLGYCVSIYDVTTDRRWEVVLHRHTAERNASVHRLDEWHGCYNTNQDDDHQTWIQAATPGRFFFSELADVLYFGNSDTGLLAYFPAAFDDQREMGLPTAFIRETAPPHEETALVVRATARQDAVEGYTYLTDSEFPKTNLVASLWGRLAYVVDRTVFFSDPPDRATGAPFPTAIVADNTIQVPSELPIVGLKELRSALYIWTDAETFVYYPNPDYVISGGSLRKLSSTIGCVGQAAICAREQDIIWVSSTGVYRTSGNEVIEELSGDIANFWRDQISDPAMAYFVDDGRTTAVDYEQPRIAYRFEPEDVSVCYYPPLDLLLVSVPRQACALALSNGQWSIWSWESPVVMDGIRQYALQEDKGYPASANPTDPVPVVGVSRVIDGAQLVTDGDRLFLVGGLDEQPVEDDGEAADDKRARAYYVLEYGRGGGLDRSVDDEDSRKLQGYYEPDHVGADGAFYLGKPEPVPEGYIHPNAGAAAEDTYLVPLRVVNPDTWAGAGGVGVDHFGIYFTFDADNWAPVCYGANAELDVEFHPARAFPAAAGGFAENYSGGGPATRGIVCTMMGALDPAGDTIEIQFDGASAPGPAWDHAPYLNLRQRGLETICWLPFRKLARRTDCVHMNVAIGGAALSDLTLAVTKNPYVWIWRGPAVLVDKLRDRDATAQTVSWCYKTGQVDGQGQRLMCRGAYLDVECTGPGEATARIDKRAWIWGLLNALLAADRRGWVTQVGDIAHRPEQIGYVHDKSPLRNRIITPANVVGQQVFGSSSALWGEDGPTDGTVLASDGFAGTVSLSLRAKGERFSLMLFGEVAAAAERLSLRSIRGTYIPVGPRRRRGAGEQRGSRPTYTEVP